MNVLLIKFLSPCVAMVWATIWFAQCQTTSKSSPKNFPKTDKAAAAKPAGIISGDKTGILVSAGWMRKYETLEKKHGSVTADQETYMEGDQYRISSGVVDHFSDMVRSGETPK